MKKQLLGISVVALIATTVYFSDFSSNPELVDLAENDYPGNVDLKSNRLASARLPEETNELQSQHREDGANVLTDLKTEQSEKVYNSIDASQVEAYSVAEYEAADVKLIIKSISSNEGLQGESSEKLLKSNRFEEVLYALEKRTERAYEVQENISSVLNDNLQLYNEIYEHIEVNCDDSICLAAFEFQSLDAWNDFMLEILSGSDYPLAVIPYMSDVGGISVMKVIFNHKNPTLNYKHPG